MDYEEGIRLDRIEAKLDALLKGQQIMAVTLDDVLADVTAETTTLDSVAKLIQGLKDQVSQIGNLTPEQQAKLDAIFAAAEINKAKIAAALVANVPSAP